MNYRDAQQFVKYIADNALCFEPHTGGVLKKNDILIGWDGGNVGDDPTFVACRDYLSDEQLDIAEALALAMDGMAEFEETIIIPAWILLP